MTLRPKTLEEIARTKLKILRRKVNSREFLIDTYRSLSMDALALLMRKNDDYGATEDAFENFRIFGSLGILVRMSDKFQRLRGFEKRGEFSVTDETLRDTILDLINYAAIYYAYKQSNNDQSETLRSVSPSPVAPELPTTGVRFPGPDPDY